MSRPKSITEIERRYWVDDLPSYVTALDEHADGSRTHGSKLLIQGYFFAKDDFAIRIRATIPNFALGRSDVRFDSDRLRDLSEKVTSVEIGAKGPRSGASRLEWEGDFPRDLGIDLLVRSPALIVKNRFGYWFGDYGWDIDVFAGTNAPLILAECETEKYVTHLSTPPFCRREITSDYRFNNENLAFKPYPTWGGEFERELGFRH